MLFRSGKDFDEFQAQLDELGGPTDGPIHKAGLYVLGDTAQVLRIGEGGKSSKRKDSGTMGHRVFTRIKDAPWKTEIRVALFLPIQPPELSRLAEQEAFAHHFQAEGRLPQYNYAWR